MKTGKRSSVEDVIARLTEQLSAGTWRPGERIPTEQELSGELDVSRAVVREAVRALVHLGVLESRQGSGTYVVSATDPTPMLRQLNLARVRDVFEVQLGYDMTAARFAADRRTEDDIARLRALLRRRDEATAPDEFGAAEIDFHQAVVEVAGNPLLLEMYRYLLSRLRESLETLRAAHELTESGPQAHRALVDAIAAGDPDAAARAAQAVIEPSLDSLRGAIDGDR